MTNRERKGGEKIELTDLTIPLPAEHQLGVILFIRLRPKQLSHRNLEWKGKGKNNIGPKFVESTEDIMHFVQPIFFVPLSFGFPFLFPFLLPSALPSQTRINHTSRWQEHSE